MTCPGPFACPFPDASGHRPRDRWHCPGCGTRYVLAFRRCWRRSLREFPWKRMILPAVAVALSCWALSGAVPF